MLSSDDFISISSGVVYHGFTHRIEITDTATVITEIKDLIESSYILDTLDMAKAIDFINKESKNIKPISRYKMTQSVYNERLIRFVNKVLLTNKDFVLSDGSRKFLSRYEMLGSFRGSLSLSADEFAKKVIDLTWS